MTPKERQKAIKYLTNKRNSLKSRGANPRNVNQYLGQNGAFVKFSSLNDNQLKRMVDRAKSQPDVTVVNGAIYPRNYIKNREYLETQEGYQPLLKDYQTALKSNLSYMTNKEYIKWRKKVNKDTKDAWNKAIRDAYGNINERQERFNKTFTNKRVKELMKFMGGLNPKQLSDFLDVVDTRLGFSHIKYAIIQKGLVRDIDDGSELFEALAKELDVLYSLYKEFIM